ncbi:MAG: pyruvate, phosphate dikinase [Nitrososphaerales archaeon]
MEKVLLFEEAAGRDKFLLGGKGYGLAQMTAIGLPVPPGFTITTEVCKQFYAQGGRIPTGLFDDIRLKVREIEAKTGKRFGDSQNPLLFSVRSGGPFSMPGMMDTILNLGLSDATAEALARKTGNERFVYDSYRRLIQMFGKVAMGADGDKFEHELVELKKTSGAKADIDLKPQELRDLVETFKRIVRTETGREFPQDPFEQLETAVTAVFMSWNNSRAKEYRRFYKISDDLGTAVNIQTMVFGNMGPDSGSGVGFTRNPSTGDRELYGEYLGNAQGEDVVAGVRTPITIESLEPSLRKELVDLASRLEKHFRDMQDFEFTVEGGKLYLLQTRNGKRTAQAAVKVAVDMMEEGLIGSEEGLMRVEPEMLDALLHRRLDPTAADQPVAKGLNASPGAASGKVVFDTDEAASTGAGEKIILVRPETTPEDIKGLIASQGVLTARGGMTSHAAVVARGMGKPAIVGCSEIEISQDGTAFTTKSGERIAKGETITIDGTSGKVYRGEVRMVDPELSPEFSKLLEKADSVRKLGVWANADTRNLYRLSPFQLADFKGIFSAMGGRPVVVRLLDLPLHEFLPPIEELIVEIQQMKEEGSTPAQLQAKQAVLDRVRQLAEHNPMLGHRGCRLAVTYPEIYEMQTKALMREKGETPNVKIMIPLVAHVGELKLLRKVIEGAASELFKEIGTTVGLQVGTMIETPRAALTADEIAKDADFFSFGTNDLTQTTFGFSRDDVEAKFIPQYIKLGILACSPFDSIDPSGVGRLVRMAVEAGRKTKPNLEVGICGEHGGDPKSIALFSEAGLNYVSCSAFRVPIARLAAAQAVIGKKAVSSTV